MHSRLEELRKARGWSRLELATHANVTESTIIRAERTTPPPIRTTSLAAIARALEVSVAELCEPLELGEPDTVPGPALDADVLFMPDLARVLRTTVRRLRAIRKGEPWKLPEELPALDNRPRWSRVKVEHWLELRDAERRTRERAAARVAGGRR
jgi:transcriptional regulator with XRE-family HTH domain